MFQSMSAGGDAQLGVWMNNITFQTMSGGGGGSSIGMQVCEQISLLALTKLDISNFTITYISMNDAYRNKY